MQNFDRFTNYSYGEVAAGGFNAGATTIPLLDGVASRFPDAPFDIGVFSQTNYPDDPGAAFHASEFEIIRVTNDPDEVLNQFTGCTRGQQGTGATDWSNKGTIIVFQDFWGVDLEDLFSGTWHNVKWRKYGATGDGTTNDTSEVQAAINAIPAAGGTVFFPPGDYLCGNLTITNKSNLTIRGCSGAKISWTGTGAPNIGFQQTGTNSRITICDLEMEGDGVVGNAHAGLWNSDGVTMTDITMRNCYVHSCTIGISLYRLTSGEITRFSIEGNRFENIRGTASGSGYAIHHGNQSGNPSNGRIVGNYVKDASRHSIYQGNGSGVVIANNTIHNHRDTDGTGTSFVTAISVARSSDIVVEGNVIIGSKDGSFEANHAGESWAGQRILFKNNIIAGGQNAIPPIYIGPQSPSVNGSTDGVTIEGNTIHHTINISLLRAYSGKRLRIIGNDFTLLNSNSGNQSIIDLRAEEESSGSATYSDAWEVSHNRFYGTTVSGQLHSISMDADFAESSVALRCIGNHVDNPHNFAYCPYTILNPNITIEGQEASGLAVGDYDAPDGDRKVASDLYVGGKVEITGNVGFYGTSAVAQQIVNGSRGGNAALASLLTALENLGLIVDYTS